MTLENAYIFLKHFNDLADGTIPQPFGHKDWADVVHNAKLRAADMEKKIEFLLKLPVYYNEPENVERRKKEEAAKAKAEAAKKAKLKKEAEDGKK